MKYAALALVFSLTWYGSAHAQAWPNATPSPYGAAAAPAPAAAPVMSTPASPVPTGNGAELGVPPHALGATTPAESAAPPVTASANGAPPVADLDNPEGGRATTALNILEAQGYAAFSDFRPEGSAFTASVSDGGQQFQVVINPDTGQISRQ